MLDLVHRALARRFIGPITQDFGSMPETAAGEMIVSHFDDDLRSDWLPFAGSFGTPATRTAGSVARKSRPLLQRFKLLRQRAPFARFESRSKPDVMEQAVVIVEAEKQRADHARARRVAKTADHAIGGPNLFHLHHCSPFAGRVRRLELFRDHAVKISADFVEPFLRLRQVGRRGRQAHYTFRL